MKNEQNVNAEEGLLENEKTEEEKQASLSKQEIDNMKNKFSSLNNSIGNMEAFHHSISLVFEVWMRYIKANEYKSHIY
jgi:hypothetical protein